MWVWLVWVSKWVDAGMRYEPPLGTEQHEEARFQTP